MMDFVTLSKILPILIYPFSVMLWLLLLAFVLLMLKKVRGAAVSVAVAVAIFVVCGNPTLAAGLYARHERTFRALPPLALQMLVENCIKHNMITSEKPTY